MLLIGIGSLTYLFLNIFHGLGYHSNDHSNRKDLNHKHGGSDRVYNNTINDDIPLVVRLC